MALYLITFYLVIGQKMFNETHKSGDHFRGNYGNYGNYNNSSELRNFSSTFRSNQNSYIRGYKLLNEDDEAMNEFITRIQYLWNQLGILEEYRQLFGVVANQLDDGNRHDFYENEIENLKLLYELLTVLYLFINNYWIDTDQGNTRQGRINRRPSSARFRSWVYAIKQSISNRRLLLR